MTGSRWRSAAGGAVLVCALALAGCGGTGLTLGRRAVSSCYRAIPTALAATGDPHARMVGVHALGLRQVRHQLPALVDALPVGDGRVCAVAVKGPFPAGQVRRARDPGTAGRFAIVLVDARDLHVLTSWVTDRLPRRLGSRVF